MRYLMYYKDGYLKKYPLNGERVTIGRSRSCDIVLDDPSVSRHHCRVEVFPGHIRLVNEKSKNGTTVDHQPVEEAVLALNQSFGVGGHEFFLQKRGSCPCSVSVQNWPGCRDTCCEHARAARRRPRPGKGARSTVHCWTN
jgi:hypothetical protein